MLDLTKIIGFEWDGGDRRKTDKHGVAMAQAEKSFFNAPLWLPADGKRCRREPRHHALGETDEGRVLHVAFTLRKSATPIRVISVRGMHRKLHGR
jgi:uncharacterized DUF497 family protein